VTSSWSFILQLFKDDFPTQP